MTKSKNSLPYLMGVSQACRIAAFNLENALISNHNTTQLMGLVKERIKTELTKFQENHNPEFCNGVRAFLTSLDHI
jgi:hypothetical protein